MNLKNKIKKISQIWLLGIFTITNTALPVFNTAQAGDSEIVYPLQEISKLDCRFQDFDTLSSDCKQKLPVLKTKDYAKYAAKNGGYNDYTRLYTVLWWASYKYGWDVWHGGHIGTDIATAKGTPIYSMADGTVIHSKTDVALWKMVSIEHYIDGKKIVSNYAHMSEIIAKKWQKVKAGQLIWKVGSTGNSTGNHLHFQLDLDTPFHPYYYSYNNCPYSYYKITEDWVCFDELEKNTIDPLKFLETKGSILKDIQVTGSYDSSATTVTPTSTDEYVFNRTVYIGYNKNDIKAVQRIYKDLGVYKWSINGNYEDIEDDIIQYQLNTGVISSKSEYGAGRFGPKTRAQTKSDYDKFLASGEKITVDEENTEKVYITTNVKTEKISRQNILSREEIEAREVENFLKKYNVSLSFEDVWWNVQVWKTTKINLEITDKRWKGFKGNMPGGMTFIADTSTVQMFPERLFYFTDGQRDILVKGLKPGNITISVKIGGTIIKRIPIKVYESGKTIYPSKAVIIGNTSPILGEANTAVVVFKDDSGRNLINLEYGSTYKVNTNNGTKICLKQWNVNSLSKLAKTKCDESEYKDHVTFTYDDTIWGIAVFDYKSLNKNTKLEIVNTYDNSVLVTQKLNVKDPKGLKTNYVYREDVLSLLSEWVADWINQWYFLEDRDITKLDTLNWIENALNEYKDSAISNDVASKIDTNIDYIQAAKTKVGKYTKISRKDFLELTYEFLVFDTNTNVALKQYRDLDNVSNIKASYVLNNTTWKDQFGENYFQPDNNITRWEAAFMVNNILNQNKNVYLTLR